MRIGTVVIRGNSVVMLEVCSNPNLSIYTEANVNYMHRLSNVYNYGDGTRQARGCAEMSIVHDF